MQSKSERPVKKKENTAVLALLITSCINREKEDGGDFCASYLEKDAAWTEAIRNSRWGFQANKSRLKLLCSSAPSAWEQVQNGSFRLWIVHLQQQSYHHT